MDHPFSCANPSKSCKTRTIECHISTGRHIRFDDDGEFGGETEYIPRNCGVGEGREDGGQQEVQVQKCGQGVRG